MKTCKIVEISVYEPKTTHHPNGRHYLKYRLNDKDGLRSEEYGSRAIAYVAAKRMGYQRVYGLSKCERLGFMTSGLPEIYTFAT